MSYQLTPAQAERLAILIEELGEAAQAACKILRHGFENGHPNGMRTNRTQLEVEIGDVLVAVDMLIAAADLRSEVIRSRRSTKPQVMKPYLHHQ